MYLQCSLKQNWVMHNEMNLHPSICIFGFLNVGLKSVNIQWLNSNYLYRLTGQKKELGNSFSQFLLVSKLKKWSNKKYVMEATEKTKVRNCCPGHVHKAFLFLPWVFWQGHWLGEDGGQPFFWNAFRKAILGYTDCTLEKVHVTCQVVNKVNLRCTEPELQTWKHISAYLFNIIGVNFWFRERGYTFIFSSLLSYCSLLLYACICCIHGLIMYLQTFLFQKLGLKLLAGTPVADSAIMQSLFRKMNDSSLSHCYYL